MPVFSNVSDVLLWLISGPGLVVAVGAFASFVLGKMKWWNGLNGDIKVIVTFLLPLLFLVPGVMVALHMGLIVQDDVLNKIYTALIFYFSTQVTYVKLKKAGTLRVAK